MKFQKVSFEQFCKDTGCLLDDYECIALPTRATTGSAGYDFLAWRDIEIPPNESRTIPTGIRSEIDTGWVLCIYPRSGQGFKYGIRLMNTVGIVDSDYFYSDNEGHIFVKLYNPSDKPFVVKKGKGFAQGVFVPFGMTDDDHANGVRNGGFGSTTKETSK